MSYDPPRRRQPPPPAYSSASWCPKCGHGGVSTHYASAGCLNEECGECQVEHLRRICRLCRYEWPEAVVGGEPRESMLEQVRRAGREQWLSNHAEHCNEPCIGADKCCWPMPDLLRERHIVIRNNVRYSAQRP